MLIILQLCRAALPLMSVEDCGNVALPSWSYSINTLDAEQQDANDPASRIAALLLAKLADYVVPGGSRVFTVMTDSDVWLKVERVLPSSQGVRPYSPPAPLSRTPVCLGPLLKEL